VASVQPDQAPLCYRKIPSEPVTSFGDMHEVNASADFVTSDGLVIGLRELAMRYQFS
jgi:hypothetical protein